MFGRLRNGRPTAASATIWRPLYGGHRLHLSDADVKEADGIELEALPTGFVAFDVGEA